MLDLLQFYAIVNFILAACLGTYMATESILFPKVLKVWHLLLIFFLPSVITVYLLALITIPIYKLCTLKAWDKPLFKRKVRDDV